MIKVTLIILALFSFNLFAKDKNLFNGRAEVAGLEANEIISFFSVLKEAVKTENKSKVADLVNFPFEKFSKGKKARTYDRRDFIKNYDLIINSKVKKSVISQKIKDLFINSEGVMIGAGELWFGEVYTKDKTKKIVIKAIN